MPWYADLPPESVAALRELPPSAKLVARTLAAEGALTQAELASASLLPARTVRHALGLLEDEGVVISRPSVVDARHRVYSIPATDAGRRAAPRLGPMQ